MLRGDVKGITAQSMLIQQRGDKYKNAISSTFQAQANKGPTPVAKAVKQVNFIANSKSISPASEQGKTNRRQQGKSNMNSIGEHKEEDSDILHHETNDMNHRFEVASKCSGSLRSHSFSALDGFKNTRSQFSLDLNKSKFMENFIHQKISI